MSYCYPGYHDFALVKINRTFSKNEKEAARRFSTEWYITHAGNYSIGESSYNYILIKPIESYCEAYNLSREIIVVFSSYDTFEARSLDAFDGILEEYQKGRIENLFYMLVSMDERIEEVIKNFLTNQESQIVVPFTFNEIREIKNDSFFFRNKLNKHFFKRDLFNFSDPLKKDIYFFGRTQLVVELVDKHLSSENIGLFGLRKTGKTSIIYSVIRTLKQKNAIGIMIDCEDPSFNQRRWNYALFYIIKQIYQNCQITYTDLDESLFTESHASELFLKHIIKIYNETKKTMMLLFDEIENITFGKSASIHWCSDLDFVFFWQSLRSAFQKHSDLFTFALFGTNPKCIEDANILKKDNPLYSNFKPIYIKGFNVDQTREMVRRLGRLMGIKFDETIYSYLTQDYGGHPFLIRHLCSTLASLNPERPILIDRKKYQEAKVKFDREKSDYFKMILDVLKQFYYDEYEMLSLLATDDINTFTFYAKSDPSYVNHLIGYGIIRENEGEYDFQMTFPPIQTPENKRGFACFA